MAVDPACFYVTCGAVTRLKQRLTSAAASFSLSSWVPTWCFVEGFVFVLMRNAGLFLYGLDIRASCFVQEVM